MRRGRKARGERGASAVEFAIIAPLFFMLVFGLISAGIAYNYNVSMTHAAREGVRFGATLPTGTSGIPNAWFDQIADRAVQAGTGDLAATAPNQYTCVAYIGYGSPQGSATDWTRKREQSGAGAPTYSTGSATSPSSWCYDDGTGPSGNERRVQVVVRRSTDFNAILFSQTVTLSSRSSARFEAVATR